MRKNEKTWAMLFALCALVNAYAVLAYPKFRQYNIVGSAVCFAVALLLIMPTKKK
ncbi:MAG: hypothetical protein Q8P20_10745 [bacterium]|nr:hypothetical protein [bacterium]